MPTSSDLKHHFRRNGRRLTNQRRLILEAVRAIGTHADIDQIYVYVQRQMPSIDLSTVYRNLDVLCDLRLLVAADIGGGHWVYETAGEAAHHHLVCRTCGRIEQIEQREIQDLIDQIKASHAFLIDMGHMALFGLCEDCQKRA